MKHKRSLTSIALATIMLVSLCAVVSATSVSAATSSANAQTSAGLVGAPAGIVGAPAACSRGPNTYELFIRGTDNALWWRHWTSATLWSAWTSLGGVLTSSPAAATREAGIIDVYVRGTTGAVYQKELRDGTWYGWYNLGGQVALGTGPGASGWTGRQDLFVQGTNGALYWKRWTNGWGNWVNLGGTLTSSPCAVSYSDYGTGVAVRGSNGALYHKGILGYDLQWSRWYSYGGQILAGTGPGAVFMNDGLIHYFVIGTNHQLYQSAPSSPVQAVWQNLGGYLTSSPAACSHTADTIDVFAVGSNGAIYSRWTTNSGLSWDPWYRVVF